MAKKVKATTEKKPVRTLQEVNQEYTNLCARIGDTEFQRAVLGVRLNEFYAELSKLNEEAGKLKGDVNGSTDSTK